MIGHLGPRASALLDGQLTPEETERAWAHVHLCHGCRDLVEREGAVKTRLAGLSLAPCDGGRRAPDHLKGSLHMKGSLLDLSEYDGLPRGDVYLAMSGPQPARPRRSAGLAAIGGGAVGVAVMGVLALGAAPADAPSRTPITSIPSQPPAQILSPVRRADEP